MKRQTTRDKFRCSELINCGKKTADCKAKNIIDSKLTTETKKHPVAAFRISWWRSGTPCVVAC